jgi:hypothetical protein
LSLMEQKMFLMLQQICYLHFHKSFLQNIKGQLL